MLESASYQAVRIERNIQQTTINLDENEEFQRARDMVVAAVEVLAQTKEKIEKGVKS